jgi:hypothetical protein
METPLEQILSNFYKKEMIMYVAEHPDDFQEAISLAVSNKQPYSWRSAWLLWSCMEKDDPRIREHIPAIISAIKSLPDGHQRELMKILQLMELEEEHEGVLFDICASIWEKIHKQPSVRYNAFITMVKIAEKYPELLNDLGFLAQTQYLETLSPGVKRGIYKMLEKITVKK